NVVSGTVVHAILDIGIRKGARHFDAVPVTGIERRDIPEIVVIGSEAISRTAQIVFAIRGLEAEAAPSRRVVANGRLCHAPAVRADSSPEALALEEITKCQVREAAATGAIALRPQEEAWPFEEHAVRLDHGAGNVGENRRVIRSRAQVTPVQGAPRI